MDKNEYTDKYISLHAEKNAIEDEINNLSFKTDKITIKPVHFTYFSFEVHAESGATLQIKDARRLGEWLMKATENIDQVHRVIDDIVQRELEIKKLRNPNSK